MTNLLVFTCAQDLCLTRNLFIRIGQLKAWTKFNQLILYLDNDTTLDEAYVFLRSVIPLTDSAISITRSSQFNAWNENRPLAALAGYHSACKLEQDFIRIDPDVFIEKPEFFERLLTKTPWLAGRVMPFFLPVNIGDRQLSFVQGGSVFCGERARRWLQNLTAADGNEGRSNYK